MKDLKIPASYMPKPGKTGNGQPITFEDYVITEWAKSKSKKDRQAIVNKCYENQRMSSYEYIIACLSLDKK